MNSQNFVLVSGCTSSHHTTGGAMVEALNGGEGRIIPCLEIDCRIVGKKGVNTVTHKFSI